MHSTHSSSVYFHQSFEVPISSTDKSAFMQEAGPIAEKVQNYVTDTLHKFTLGNEVVNNLHRYVWGIAANSLDSYVRKDLKIGDKFRIDVLIYKKGDEFILEIRDNGPGFLKKKKGEVFAYNSSTDLVYKPSYCLGGNGTGMNELISMGNMVGYNVLVKNGDEEGASVLISFNDKPVLRKVPYSTSTKVVITSVALLALACLTYRLRLTLS